MCVCVCVCVFSIDRPAVKNLVEIEAERSTSRPKSRSVSRLAVVENEVGIEVEFWGILGGRGREVDVGVEAEVGISCRFSAVGRFGVGFES